MKIERQIELKFGKDVNSVWGEQGATETETTDYNKQNASDQNRPSPVIRLMDL